ncbi:MAG: phage shock envelope stress response protein PspM [Haloechinothrix sp.]
MSAKRGFGELAANLDKRIERLPDIAEVRSSWARWNDPAARLDRRKLRTSRALTLWIVLTILCGIAVLAGVVGASSAAGISASVFTAIAGVVVFGALGVRSGLRLRRLSRTTATATATRVALPSRASAAYEPMRRLRYAEASLAELLAQLSRSPPGATTSVPEVSVADARTTAAQAAVALRGLAGRIEAIERAADAAPHAERAALDSAVRTLCDQFDGGLDDYGSLVAAAGRAVAATSSGVASSRQALTDATDRLAGLAIALRELS